MKQKSAIRRRSRRLLAVGTAVVLGALLLAGCTSGASSDSSGTSGSTGQSGLVAPERDMGGAEQGAADSAAGGAIEGVTTDVQASDRDVITTGSVSITVTDPIEAAQTAATLTEQAGGRIDSRNETPTTDNQPASASLTLRIPADALDRTLADLKELGTVNFVSLSAADVTQQSQDLDARITSLQTSVDRLLALMTEASSTTDLIAIESALSTRQVELESLQSQRNYLSDQIDFSTLSLELYSEGTVAPSSPDNFFTGLITGWNALVATLGGLLVGLGVALPWVVSIGLVAGIVFLIVWVSTRKRKAA
ncbi:DUF4349 domain-containing protein [Cryobacterium frigoriphilum]|uniref:DUF4349 domain-containing protein n=1 Tax=Cryobacterium frigoriphilum TaxID=1259150 RepID=A0A4R8ZT96_9MICO|nr:DUF4349 domain-containing protein [Cryobacterium frigoriphilum]TFD44754.1 DUF4349 domain-containing protein [Cryobacterium frigoriphilum]